MEDFTPYSFEGELPQGYEICGETGQLLHIDLQPGQEILVEPGAMIYTSNEGSLFNHLPFYSLFHHTLYFHCLFLTS